MSVIFGVSLIGAAIFLALGYWVVPMLVRTFRGGAG